LYGIPIVRKVAMAKLVLAKVTRKGQMTIPKELREALGLQAGDYVALRPLMDGVLMSKATISSRVKAEEVVPHLVAPHGTTGATRGAAKDKDLNDAVEEIEEEIYRESTGG
jgi:AbrB family looped-hinge helix DNA binding protein